MINVVSCYKVRSSGGGGPSWWPNHVPLLLQSAKAKAKGRYWLTTSKTTLHIWAVV
jgi:hypothetical protein